jgi:paraquat-inducible protein B
MKSKLNPISVGSFVIGLVILIAIGLISFQSLSWIQKPIRFVSYFDESVQGMDVGSSVKLRGVAVGRVVAIHVEYDWESSQSKVVVVGELNQNTMSASDGKIIPISDPSILDQLIKKGLRAKIGLVGITGLQFVQLDFLDTEKEKHLENNAVASSVYPVIPTVNSGMSQLTDNLVAIAKNARKIDFAKISTDLTNTADELSVLINTLNQKTEEVDLKKMTARITAAATSIEQLADFLKQNPSSLIFGRAPKATKKPEGQGGVKNIFSKLF